MSKVYLPKVRGRVAQQRSSAGIQALVDVSLTMAESDFVCLLGPSGCGKSTFLSIVAGFERATRGEVLLRGVEVRGPGLDRGVVFQEESLFPWLTVEENVAFGLRIRGRPAAERRSVAEAYLELVGLRRFANLYPNQLSGGMKQRVAIARALANDPEVILMDEPFGALDILTREMLQQELLRIWGQTKKSVLFVTHSIEESVLLADRIVVFTRGPGRVKEDIVVDLPRPRERSDRRVLELEAHVRSAIYAEIAAGAPGATGVA